MRYLCRYIQSLGPCSSLFLLATPLAIVEPLKLLGVFIFGRGHLFSGAAVMICAYAGSVFLVERLFKIVKPKLLTLSWFLVLWMWFCSARDSTFSRVRTAWTRTRKALEQCVGRDRYFLTRFF